VALKTLAGSVACKLNVSCYRKDMKDACLSCNDLQWLTLNMLITAEYCLQSYLV